MADPVSADLELYAKAFNDKPRSFSAKMPELGKGVVQHFKWPLNMSDFAMLTTGSVAHDGVLFRAMVFSRLALAPDGTRLMDLSKDDYLDEHLIPGRLQQLAVIRSGIDKAVLGHIEEFLKEIGKGGDKSAKKSLLLSSSTTSPTAPEKTQET